MRQIIIMQLPIKNKEAYEDVYSDDPLLINAIEIDMESYEGEIFGTHLNAFFTEDGTYISFFEDEIQVIEPDEQ